MADFLTATNLVRIPVKNANLDADLTIVESPPKQRDGHSQEISDSISNSKSVQKHATPSAPRQITSPEDVLQVLRSQPDLDQLLAALNWLHLHSNRFEAKVNIHAPGPLQSQIINALVVNILPDFWPSLGTHAPQLTLCLSNVAGLNAVFTRLKFLCSGNGSGQSTQRGNAQEFDDLLDLIKVLFKGDDVVTHVFHNVLKSVPDQRRRETIWKDFVNLVGSGKVVAIVAQAHDQLQACKGDSGTSKTNIWLANGSMYSAWLGRNVEHLVKSDDKQASQAAASLLAKSLSLGYANRLLHELFGRLVPDLGSGKLNQVHVEAMLKKIPLSANRPFMEHLMRWLSSVSSSHTAERSSLSNASHIRPGALAAIIALIIGADRRLHETILLLLSDPNSSGTLSSAVRRACLAVISSSVTAADDLQTLLEKFMASFNDAIFANHAPILQQEALAEMLLMTAGYVHRQTPMALLMTARSSIHMQGVSNRLDSSNKRARWLGMVLGTAISILVDKAGARIDFGTDDMQTEESRWYMDLINVHDEVEPLRELDTLLQAQNNPAKPWKQTVKLTRSEEMPRLNGKPVFGPIPPPAQTEVIGAKVAEIFDSDEESVDDLKPYAKPDSDPEDSDEDATLVNRNKARPAVYIRDLMSMLRDDKNHDRFQLGIKHAASLIRRKSNFGAEVKDHAEEIGVILCNLQDPFSTEDFEELKLQAMIAILLSDVKTMAAWFSNQAFLGDYSIAQRCAILSALGLGGRELAGFKNEDDLNPAVSNTEFPGKRLTPYLHSIYSIDSRSTKRLDAASRDMEQALIKPLALRAADQSTAHLNAVKVRTFSSRMEVERTKRKPASNALAKIFGEAFFFPLANRYQQEIAAYSTSSIYSSAPFLLVTFLKTLALLLHASGPATTGLTDISGEFWDLLLSLRVTALGDISILQAVLFSLLTLFEISADKRQIVQDHPKQLMETQQWVDMVFERMGAGTGTSGSADEAKVQTLAAGVLVKTRGIIQAYQEELVGFRLDR